MSRTRIMDIVTLTRNGWRPYMGNPASWVYEKIGCEIVLQKKRGKPFWFVKDNVFCCIGCSTNCVLNNPDGFVPELPLEARDAPKVRKFDLTPREMLAKYDLLNVKQAAYCLNVAERTVYNMIAEGKLVRLKEQPVRVRVDEVRKLRENFDE